MTSTIGFNNRKYDNHILYVRTIGYDNRKLFELSNKIINSNRKELFSNAYDFQPYTDVLEEGTVR